MIPGHPLKIERYPDLKLVFHTRVGKYYDGFHSIKDTLWYDESPRITKPAIIKPQDLSAIHFSRFNPNAIQPMAFNHNSVVQSVFNFGSVAPFGEKRVLVTGDFCNPEVQSVALSCFAYGSFVVVPSFWFRARLTVAELSQNYCTVLVTSPSHLEKIIANPTVPAYKLVLETILIINNPHDVASSSLIERAKSTLGASRVDTAFVSDGCMSPFLYAKDATGKENLGVPVPNAEVAVTDVNGSIVPVGSVGTLKTRGLVFYIIYSNIFTYLFFFKL